MTPMSTSNYVCIIRLCLSRPCIQTLVNHSLVYVYVCVYVCVCVCNQGKPDVTVCLVKAKPTCTCTSLKDSCRANLTIMYMGRRVPLG